jgi:Ala-tRNA(Pro) deacylase
VMLNPVRRGGIGVCFFRAEVPGPNCLEWVRAQQKKGTQGPTRRHDKRLTVSPCARLKRKEEEVMALASLTEYLDGHHVPYLIIAHSPAYTAQGIAGLTHISGKELAKTVMIKLDEKMVMAVLPANFHVDLAALKRGLKAKTVALASEEEFKNRFGGCETGAMPPFGHLFGVPVFADENLARDEEIAFNAGTHRELIRMRWSDYKRLAEPMVFRFAAGHSAQAA